jgi:hypothetical protein
MKPIPLENMAGFLLIYGIRFNKVSIPGGKPVSLIAIFTL